MAYGLVYTYWSFGDYFCLYREGRKIEAIPVTGHEGPGDCETSRFPHFLDSSQIAMRLSVLRTGHDLPPGRFLILIYVRGWVDPKGLLRLKGFGQLKNLMTFSVIEISFAACSTAPQPTTLTNALREQHWNNNFFWIICKYVPGYTASLLRRL
jgi:hypothetical protein